MAVDGDRQQLLSILQATTEELEETKSSLAAANKELSALQKDFEKTKEALSSKENELEDTKSSLQTAKEELAKSQQQVKSDSEPHTGEALNKREMSLSSSADHQLSQSDVVRDSPSSTELGDYEVKQIIGKEGGLLKISDTGVSLEIPPGALEESQLIEMRIIRQNYVEEPLSFYNNASVIVELLPNHLELQQEVTLTLPHCIVLKEGIEWKAKVYSSHHDTGSQSIWRVNSEIRSLLTERNCVLWLKSFSRWKFLPDWKIAQGKRIILFAAKKKTSTNRSTLLDVGFYLEHTHAEKRLMKRDVMLDEVEGKLYKKERLPFVVMLVNVEPEHWSCEHKQKTLTFEQIAKANCMYCTFELKGDPNEPEDGTCTFKMWQKEDVCTEFLFHLRDPIPTRSESSAMGSKVLETDLEELSQKIGDSWWKIAGALQLPNADIDNIRDNNKKQEVVAYKILRKWKERNGDSATYSVLVKALRRAGRKDLGDDLETKVNDPSAETDQQRREVRQT